MASAVLRATSLAGVLAALLGLGLKVGRNATGEGALPTAKLKYKSWPESPLQAVSRKALPHERKADRFQTWTRGASLYEPFRQMPFTPVLSCEPGISVLMDRFDWRLVPESAWEAVEEDGRTFAERVATEQQERQKEGEGGKVEGDAVAGVMTCGSVDGRPWRNNSHIKDPTTVWAAPHAVEKLLSLAERDFDPSHQRRAVMFSGTEMPLSRAFGTTVEERASTLVRLRKYFGTITYMTKDIFLPGVRVAPMGLGWGYTITFMDTWVRKAAGNGRYVADKFRSFEANLSQGLEGKSKNMLATRGVWAGWLDQEWTVRRAQQLRARGEYFPPSNSSCKAIIFAVRSRRSLQRWAETPRAHAMGVDLRKLSQSEWWIELPKYRFLLSPLGSAIQTAKSVEALLVLTIPVIEKVVFPTFNDLIDLGFPFVLVDNWENITADATDHWWAEVSPRLESFRRNCLTVNGFWKMMVGAVRRCT